MMLFSSIKAKVCQTSDFQEQVLALFFDRFLSTQDTDCCQCWRSRRGNSNITISIFKNQYLQVTSPKTDLKVQKVCFPMEKRPIDINTQQILLKSRRNVRCSYISPHTFFSKQQLLVEHRQDSRGKLSK